MPDDIDIMEASSAFGKKSVDNVKRKSYHKRDIAKGVIGELSKIQEELEELIDAEAQGNSIMALVEISDLYGAIEMYLLKHYPSMSMRDVKVMSRATQQSFMSGARK